MRKMKGIGVGLTCTHKGLYERNMRVIKGIGLGLTCTHKGIYEGNERDRVRVNMHL